MHDERLISDLVCGPTFTIVQDLHEKKLPESEMAMIVRALVDVMAAQPQDTKLQTTICLCFAAISKNSPSYRVCLRRGNIITAIVNAMNKHADNVELQTSAMYALLDHIMEAALAVESSADMPLHAPEQDAMDLMMKAMLNAMRRHGSNEDIQAHAIASMDNICIYSNTSSKKLLMEHGAVGEIARSMRACRNCSLLQVAGARLLSNLIFQSEGME
jgi:hypothetical protein